jgi:hypothetical protein
MASVAETIAQPTRSQASGKPGESDRAHVLSLCEHQCTTPARIHQFLLPTTSATPPVISGTHSSRLSAINPFKQWPKLLA